MRATELRRRIECRGRAQGAADSLRQRPHLRAL